MKPTNADTRIITNNLQLGQLEGNHNSIGSTHHALRTRNHADLTDSAVSGTTIDPDHNLRRFGATSHRD